MTSRVTEAARRILLEALESARRRASLNVEPIDLFAALLADESRGATLFSEYGVSAHEPATATFLAELLEENLDRVSLNPKESAEYAAVVESAKHRAALAGRTAEMGSEHLAFGLSDVPSAVRDFLSGRGATADALQRSLEASGETFGEPIPTDVVLDVGATAFDRRHVLRAIDAAANRASEGLRVAEDFARFVRDDALLTRQLKNLRHAIVEALATVPLPARLASRDTVGDVGTTIGSPSATTRATESDLLTANLHRAEEALRSLEEFGRLIEPTLGPTFERLRYELYTIEKLLAGALAAQEKLADRDLYVLLTLAQCACSIEEVIRGSAAAGAGIFQVREKSLADRQLLAHLKTIRRVTADVGALLIVNDRPDLAVLCGADGVHVGQEELAVRDARRIVGLDRLVGVSAHSIEQARAAVLDGADYLGVGPVFVSQTKSFDSLAGLEFVSQAAAEIGLPWYAIGGISPQNVGDVCKAGAKRVAVSSVICAARDPRVVATSLISSVHAVRK